MKIFRRCASMILACVILLGTSAYAVPRASEQIAMYYLDAGSGGNGLIAVDFTISATGTMKNIGAESIVIYKKAAIGWEFVERYNADDVDMEGNAMSISDAPHYGTTIFHQGEPNQEYQVTVTVFAEDYEGGSDSRSKTFTFET